jgi:sugar lactone lactonase YvrE
MTTTPRRVAMLIAFAMGVSLALAPAVAAHDKDVSDLPARIDLPDGWQPEGIESWGKWLYSGSLANGAIWRANAKTGEGRILVEGEAGKVAVGLHLDRWGRLWVAGGPTGQVRVYKAKTGKLLQTYTFPTDPALFFNDLDISRDRVVVTDSFNARVAVIPLREHGKLPDPSKAFFLALKGDFALQPGFNLNGIAARGGWMVTVQSGTGFLFRLNPKTGDTTRIDTGGYLVSNGDGLDFRGRTLYAVRNVDNTVAVLRVSESLKRSKLKGEIQRDPPVLDVPTTATTTLGALWVVNARFSTPPGPAVDYWITRLPLTPDS